MATQTSSVLAVPTGLKTGRSNLNHSTTLAGIAVRTDVKTGGADRSSPQGRLIMNKTRLVLLLTITVMLAANVAPVAAWDWLWSHQIGSSVFINAYGGAADAEGAYVTGAVLGDLPGTTGQGDLDAYLRKLDHAGNVLWTRRVGTPSYDEAAGVALDADGAYITGTTCGAFGGQVLAGECDAYVAKLSPAGDLLWVSQFGTPALDVAYQYGAIAVHSTGVYVAGKTYGTFPGATPVGAPNTFLARLDAGTGAVLWVRQFGAPDYRSFIAGGVGVDETGIAVGANAADSTGIVWTAEVRKYDFHGNVQWSRVFDQTNAPCGHPIFNVAAHRGQVYAIGQTFETKLTSCELGPFGRSYVIGHLQKFDDSGDTVWERRIKGGSPDRPGGAGAVFTGAKVVLATDAGLFIGANLKKLKFAGFVDREPRSDHSECGDRGPIENSVWAAFDGYVRRYDFDGNVIWTHQFGSGLFDLVSGLGSDGEAVYAAGMTRCVLEEGAEAENGSLVDGFLVRFAIDPTSHSGRVQLIVGQIETLSDAGRIPSGSFNALVSHLESALSALDSSHPTGATNALRAFVRLVENYAANDRLTGAEAEALITAATAILGDL